jgi:hypothetical protein
MAQDPNYGLYQEHSTIRAPLYPSGIGVGRLFFCLLIFGFPRRLPF